jgi:hypothetical protein
MVIGKFKTVALVAGALILGGSALATADEPSRAAASSKAIERSVSEQSQIESRCAVDRPLDRRHQRCRGRSGRWW